MFLFELYPSSLMAVRRAEHRLKAVHIAQSILEEKRFAAFSTLSAPPDDMSDVRGDDGMIYRKTDYQCFDVPGSNPDYLKGIRVTVMWKERDQQYSITQEIYVYRVQH